MADLSALLAVIEHDPDDTQALDALEAAARAVTPQIKGPKFAATRKILATRGRPDTVVALLDAEIDAESDKSRKADLLLEKGMVLESELLDVSLAHAAFASVLELRKGDAMATEALEQLGVDEENWKKYAAKFIHEATASTDRNLATGLYVSAAEQYVRFAPDAPEAEAYLRKALEIDPKNAKAAFHLMRLLRRSNRWQDLGELLDERAERAAAIEDRISALNALSEIARTHLGNASRADRAIKRVLVLDPTHPRALRHVTDAAAAAGDWASVVGAYQAALKTRRDGDDLGMLLQIAMVLWKHMNDLDQSEEYFRRIRKLEPAHPAALDFYRAYYSAKGESGKLISLLKSVEKNVPRSRTDSGEKSVSIEIAELAEAQNNPEKAIEAWKQHLRSDATSVQARTALARLYRRTEKWNALLDLMKDEIERLPEGDIEGRAGRLFEIAEIYRDRLRLDVMVINTYNAILKIDPENLRATDELAAKFRGLGRWNDLIAVLTRKAEAPNLPDADRVKLLREVADLWSERFGNFANAIKPLERIAELMPSDADAVGKLKEIYTKRRQWRQLIDLLGKEATTLPSGEKRLKQSEMARLAAERLGDTRLAIEIHNRVLADAPEAGETLAALAGLYDREKRWLALAEILHRQVAVLRGEKRTKEAIVLLEKLGQVYSDRLAAPQQGAGAWKEILDLEPNHAKALRTLRELYAMAGDFVGLEMLYTKLGQEDELPEALLAISDRIDAKSARLPLIERAAQLAQKRAENAPVTKPTSGQIALPRTITSDPLEKSRQVWERVLAVEPNHVGAAAALVPIYTKQEKWARLLAVLEIALTAIQEPTARLAKVNEIRLLCEQKLNSRTLAFTWAVRAFEIAPESEELYGDVLRLANEPDQWRDLAAAFERAIARDIPEALRLKLFRKLAEIANRRLGDPERARGYHRQVLSLAPDDRDAEANLEDLAQAVADWNDLLVSYRRRVAREADPVAKSNLLLATAQLQEQKLNDLDGAAATYREILAALPGHMKALRSLARLDEARGDWESLAEVLAEQLKQTPDGQPRFELLMRVGQIEETNLDAPANALDYYRDALAIPGVGGGVRREALDAVARIVLTPALASALDPPDRLAAARQILQHLESAPAQHAAALEIIRNADDTGAHEKTEIDRTLMRLYHIDLGDPAAAWQAGLRVIRAEPGDGEMRGALSVLAGQLGRDGEWSSELAAGLASLKQKGGSSSEIRAVATELARLAGDRMGDRATAERAWISVLEVEPDAADAFEALSDQYKREERWQDLRAALERRAEVTIDQNTRLATLLALAQLEEETLGEPGRSGQAYRRVLEIDAGNQLAYVSLDRLYSSTQKWTELEELLARWSDHTEQERISELSFRRAELFVHKLNDSGRAVDLLEDVLGRVRSHAGARELLEELMTAPGVQIVMMRIVRLLEPLYEQERQWGDLVQLLRAQRASVSGTEAVELLSRIAKIEEAELNGARTAFDCWLEVLKLEPAHERARIEIARLAQYLGRWPEATAALEAAVSATPESDASTRAAILGELATYYDSQGGDTERAIVAYKRLLEADPTSPITIRRAGTALARLYEESSKWRELREIIHQQAEWAEDPGERRALLARVAQLDEDKLGDRTAAIATWRDVLSDQSNDAGALHALERLYLAAEGWRDLAEILRRRIDGASTEVEAIELLVRVAEVNEHKLGDPEEAIAAWLEIIDRDTEDTRALNELARLYVAAERWADLLDVYERQAMLYDGPAQTDLQIQIARLLSGHLSRPVEALDRWATVLRADPQQPTALAAVEASLEDSDLRVAAADILRPVYASTGQEQRIAQLSLLQADWTDDPATRLRALLEVVRLRERLGDKTGAFEVQLQALKNAATEPELAQVVDDTERLAGELGREADLIDAFIQIAPDVLDAEIQRGLYFDIADLARAVRRDLDLAREFYLKVLDASPEDRRALSALEGIYREKDEPEKLVEVLLRQADVAADTDDKVNELVEAAGLYVTLKRPDDAITTWEQVILIAPERADAIYALEALYSQQGRWPDVVELYERRLGFVTTMDEAVALRIQLGDLHEKQLRDVQAAIENYSAALSGNAQQPQALAALERYLNDPDARVMAAEVLEPIYVGQQRWQDLVRVYTSKLDGAVEPDERLRLTRFVARLYEEQLEDFESACKWYARVFREAPGDHAVREQLQRLGGIIENWGFVAETYQSYLDDESGDSEEVRDVAIAAATVYDRRLNQVDLAYAAYRRALGIDSEAKPDARELVRRIEDLCSRNQRWSELLAVYEDVIARTDEDLRREALFKRARLLEDGLQDQVRAIEAWREVVLVTEGGETPVLEHTYRESVAELERLYRGRTQWRELVDLFEARLARALDASALVEVAELRLRLADIYENNLNDLTGALDQYEEVINGGKLWDRAVASLERLVVHDEHRERIASLLEPVYREQDWWQKLVVILDAKLEYINDPPQQVATLHEIAEIHERRGGAIDLALGALARAWRIDVADEHSLARLLSLAGKLGAWHEAVRTLEDGASSVDGDLAGSLWQKAAEIHEKQRKDLKAAIEAWRKVDENRSDDPVALAQLDRLLALEGRVEELVKVVERRAELTEDAGVRLVLLHRVAALYEEVLEDKPLAIAAYKNVLALDDTDLSALDALERLYRDTGDAREMVVTLERKIELTTELPSRQDLRFASAQVYEHHLDDVYQAISQLTSMLDDDAGDARALGELDRIYAKNKMWPELLDIVDKRALLAHTQKERADLAFRAAHLVESQLTDPDAAVPRYGAVLTIDPAHAEARAALETLMVKDEHVDSVTPVLERIYRTDRDAAGLVRVYERRLGVQGREPSARRADWEALAEVRESLANQPAQAFVVWGRAFADAPEDTDLLEPLTRLAEQQKLWGELAGLLEERLADGAPTLPPETEQTYAMRLGQISEERLHDLDRAALAYGRASQGSEPRAPLAALERVLTRANRWPDLAHVLRREADVAENDNETAEYLFRLADLQETTLGSHKLAIATYREVLNLTSVHGGARAALERLLTTSPDDVRDIVETLEPLFEQDEDYPRLVMVLDAKLSTVEDPVDRASLLQRIVELSEHKLNDGGRALEAALRWLTADPSSSQALSEVDRLSDRLGQWRETASRLDAIVHGKDAADRAPDVQVSLLVFLGKVLRERLGQNEDAVTIYKQALAIEPESLTALDALVDLHRQRGDTSALADVLRQRGRIVQELPEKRAAFAEVAQLCERAGDTAGAIEAWREIIDADEADRPALDQLARIYRAGGKDPVALVEVLGRAAQLASDPGDEKALRVEIAQIETDGPRGVAAWQAVVDLAPDDTNALSALEAAFARAGDWIAVGDTQMRRLDLAQTPKEKVLIHAEMARLAETRRNSVDDAIGAWYAALEIDANYLRAYDELERLLALGNRYHDLVEVLEKRGEVHAIANDTGAELATLARAADVWEGKLDNPDAAGEILEKILKREPGSVAALTRLSKIYERSSDWDKCKATLEQALKLNPQGRDAADLFFRLGEVARLGDSDETTAIQHFQQALRYDASHKEAVTSLEKLARDRKDNILLADMLQRRVATITVPAERVALLVEIAELERKANRNDAALTALAQAAKDAPEDIRVLGPLADLYFAAGRLEEAAPIFDRLATDAKAARRMKDVAKYRQRQGGILEARGDRAGALAAYEEALRVNPTDVVTMTGLGRMYFDSGDWEKARKIYQSLVLQNIDTDVGVTKGEVYWALGRIHIELGQSPKAKSMFQRGLELEPTNQKLREALSSLQ